MANQEREVKREDVCWRTMPDCMNCPSYNQCIIPQDMNKRYELADRDT
jgi:hypothetical protein